MSYEMDPRMREELDEIMAQIDAMIHEVEAEPPLMVWYCDEDGNLERYVISCWTWEEATRLGKAAAIAAGHRTRIVDVGV